MKLEGDTLTIDDEEFDVNEFVFTANGVEISPKDLVGWYNVVKEKSNVVYTLHDATISFSQG